MAMAGEQELAGLPLRERRKAMTRQAIVTAAETLFEARGYDRVTVAEIADAANVSVKTLFVYFRSKEDLAFSDDSLIVDLLGALRRRDPGVSPTTAVVETVIALLHQEGGVSGLEGYRRAFGDSVALEARLGRMWHDFEDRVVAELAHETAGPATPDQRLTAIGLIGIVRTLTAPEVHARTAGRSAAAATADLEQWLRGLTRTTGP